MLLEKIYQPYAENFSKSEYIKIIYSANVFHDFKKAVEIAVFSRYMKYQIFVNYILYSNSQYFND